MYHVHRPSLRCRRFVFFDPFVALSSYLQLDIVIENHKYLTLGYALFTEEKQLKPLIYIYEK